MDHPLVVGFVGRKRAGKDTLCRLLRQDLQEYKLGMIRMALADPVKDHVAELLGIPREWCDDLERKEQALESWGGLTIRRALQHYGTEVCRKIHPDIWIEMLVRKIHGLQGQGFVGVTDVRFVNEAESLRRVFGDRCRLIRIHGPKTTIVDEHASEREIDQIETDFEVDNGDREFGMWGLRTSAPYQNVLWELVAWAQLVYEEKQSA